MSIWGYWCADGCSIWCFGVQELRDGKGGGNGEWEAAASSLHGAHPDFAKFEHKRTLFLWRCKHKPRR